MHIKILQIINLAVWFFGVKSPSEWPNQLGNFLSYNETFLHSCTRQLQLSASFPFQWLSEALYPYVAPRLYMCVVSKWQCKAHMNVLRSMNVWALLFSQRKNKLNLAPLLKLSAYRINFPFLWHCVSLQVWLAPHESFFPPQRSSEQSGEGPTYQSWVGSGR